MFGKPLMTVIYYHLDDILIDTGPYSARKSVKRYLENHAIHKALLTHYHEDHSGNAGLLVNNGIPVYGHQLTKSKLEKKNQLKPYEHILFGKLEQTSIEPLTEAVHTKHYALIPVHTPGHSSDHTVFHEPNRGWLFSGDLFLGPRIKYWRKDEDMYETIRSLERVLKLDFAQLFCGHNPKLRKPKRYIELKRQQLLELVDKVSGLSKLGHNSRDIIKLLAKGKETYIAKWFTLGDASYKNMIMAAIAVATHENKPL